MTADVFDIVGLASRAGGDMGLVLELLEHFPTIARKEAAAIEAALRTHRPADLRRHAHRIRGSLLALGAYRAAECAGELEALASGGAVDVEVVDSIANRFRTALAEASAEFARSASQLRGRQTLDVCH